MYDPELNYTDKMVGNLCQYIFDLDLNDVIIIITSDHGELLGERGLFAHGGYPLEGLINVPLVTIGLGVDYSSDRLIQHSDISYKLLQRAGKTFDNSDGIDIESSRPCGLAVVLSINNINPV